MGVGSAKGKDKAELAAKAAISSPLLESSIAGAKGLIVSIMASPDIGLEETDVASTLIAEEAHPDANLIWGAAFDPSLEDEMRITVIATNFDTAPAGARMTAKAEAAQNATAAEAAETISKNEFEDMLKVLERGSR